MIKTIGDYLIILVSVIGSLLSIFGFVTIFKPHLNDQGWIGVVFLGLIAIFFLIYNLYLISKYRKRIRYADAFEDLNIGFAELHRLTRDSGVDVDLIIRNVITLCNSTSDVFSKIYGHHIGVCVKFIVIPTDRAYARTLARDKKSSQHRKSGQKDEGEHWLDLNSDFNFLHANFDNEIQDTTFYYQTYLPYRAGYQNTRLKNWHPPKAFWPLNIIIRGLYWPLRYRCTLVVPIVPLLAEDQSKKAVRGFLCIDSPRMKCFNTQYDVEILKGISDGLYNTIDKLESSV